VRPSNLLVSDTANVLAGANFGTVLGLLQLFYAGTGLRLVTLCAPAIGSALLK
jgi:hypothetical protein